MNAVKRHFGKTGGRTGYHAYQSFAPGEVMPELAHRLGIELAEALWGSRFQVVVATHLDCGHLHNHFVINSVSFADGKRFHSDAKFLRQFQTVSDRLCRENGLSAIERPQRGGTRSHGEVAAERTGRLTWRGLIQADVDQAIAASMTERQFFAFLREQGYEYKIGQDISLRPPGKERFFRLERNLGEDYSISAIRQRLGRSGPKKSVQIIPQMPIKQHYRLKGTLPKHQRSHLRRLYLYYCYRLKILRKQPQSARKTPFLLREELLKLDKYTREICLLHTYRLDTDVQLSAFQTEKEAELESLLCQRQSLRNRLRRMTDDEKIKPVKEEIFALSQKIIVTRRKVKLCEDIQIHAKEMTERLRAIHREAPRKEEKAYGYQRAGR